MQINDHIQVTKKTPQQYNLKLLAFSKATEYVTDDLYLQIGDVQDSLSYKWTNEKKRVKAMVDKLENTVNRLYTVAKNLNDLYDEAIGSLL